MLSLAGMTGVVEAKDKPSPSGTWKQTISTNGRTSVTTYRLKLVGDKITGTIIANNGQKTPIEDGKYEDGKITFKVIRQWPNGEKGSASYTGKMSGDTIIGNIEYERGGKESGGGFWRMTRVKE
jgi:hypothetical protein